MLRRFVCLSSDQARARDGKTERRRNRRTPGQTDARSPFSGEVIMSGLLQILLQRKQTDGRSGQPALVQDASRPLSSCESLSYHGLADQIALLGTGLRRRDVQIGSVVGLALGRSTEHVV